MTDSQWLEIRGWITERLAAERKFSIAADTFVEHFGLTRPFYADMIGFARRDRCKFSFHSPWKYSPAGDPALDGEPADHIHFERED